MIFANGGSIKTPQGATLIFGTDAGVVLGDGGVIELGEGGALSGLTEQALSGFDAIPAGSSVTLGVAGGITFGPGGSIDFGAGGNIEYAENSTVTISNANAVDVHSDSGSTITVEGIQTNGGVTLHADNDLKLTGIYSGSGVLMQSTDNASTLTISAANITVNGENLAAGQWDISQGDATTPIDLPPTEPCPDLSTPPANSGSITITAAGGTEIVADIAGQPTPVSTNGCTVISPPNANIDLPSVVQPEGGSTLVNQGETNVQVTSNTETKEPENPFKKIANQDKDSEGGGVFSPWCLVAFLLVIGRVLRPQIQLAIKSVKY